MSLIQQVLTGFRKKLEENAKHKEKEKYLKATEGKIWNITKKGIKSQ